MKPTAERVAPATSGAAKNEANPMPTPITATWTVKSSPAASPLAFLLFGLFVILLSAFKISIRTFVLLILDARGMSGTTSLFFPFPRRTKIDASPLIDITRLLLGFSVKSFYAKHEEYETDDVMHYLPFGNMKEKGSLSKPRYLTPNSQDRIQTGQNDPEEADE